jgi:hypothetical protein
LLAHVWQSDEMRWVLDDGATELPLTFAANTAL